jgi:hypothetical protein
MSGRHYRALSMMHQQVQEEIDRAGRSLLPDWARIGQLKRLRLSIKDRMRTLLEDRRETMVERSVARAVRRPRHSRAHSLSSDA